MAVTSGDLSQDPEDLEAAIEGAFALATRWDAILLIDEADVFMARRRSDDYNQVLRNAMVTVFLRLVECFRGLLFLTTNRIEDFDPAFDSRIHVKIEYPELTPERRSFIWQNILQTTRIDETFTPSVIEELGKEPLNGREVTNLIRTANGLAMAEGAKLSYDHVKHVLRVISSSYQFVK